MLKESLGMLEVKGLVAAITVGDAMAKAANVHIRQKTLAKGSGWTTILVTGDVGSVNAALSAGKSIAIERGWLVSAKVIARPASSLELALEPDVNELKAKENAVTKDVKTDAAKAEDSAEEKTDDLPPVEPVVDTPKESVAGTPEEDLNTVKAKAAEKSGGKSSSAKKKSSSKKK